MFEWKADLLMQENKVFDMKKFGLVLKGEKIIVYSKPRPPMPPS